MGVIKLRHCVFATMSTLITLCFAQGNINSTDVAYVLIEVPGAIGTYPMSINDSMAVTGYYLASALVAQGFVRNSDGIITTFSVRDGMWTEPVSINATGDITGFFEMADGVPQGFVRYTDGQVVTFDLPGSNSTPQKALPVSINNYGEIAGNDPFSATSSKGFRRSTSGVFTTLSFPTGSEYLTVVTGLNASGTTIGYLQTGGSYVHSFYAQPDGFWQQFDVPAEAVEGYHLKVEHTTAESINADGVIAGLYSLHYQCTAPCGGIATYVKAGGFVRSPQGDFILFKAPGPIVTSPQMVLPEEEPGTIPGGLPINQEGTVTGSYIDANFTQHGFLRNRFGVTTSFDVPDGTQTAPTSLNDFGVIVGSFSPPWNSDSNLTIGFLRISLEPEEVGK
jgi:hypothetical protein